MQKATWGLNFFPFCLEKKISRLPFKLFNEILAHFNQSDLFFNQNLFNLILFMFHFTLSKLTGRKILKWMPQ